MTPHDQFKNNVSFPPKADINLLQLHRRKQSRGRRMSLRLSLALAVMFVAQVASADPRAGLGRDFESRYASMKAAMAAKDEMAIRSILASGLPASMSAENPKTLRT